MNEIKNALNISGANETNAELTEITDEVSAQCDTAELSAKQRPRKLR